MKKVIDYSGRNAWLNFGMVVLGVIAVNLLLYALLDIRQEIRELRQELRQMPQRTLRPSSDDRACHFLIDGAQIVASRYG